MKKFFFFTLNDLVDACFNLWVKRVGEEEEAEAGDWTRERGLDEADCKR